jgi:hypothetical protein
MEIARGSGQARDSQLSRVGDLHELAMVIVGRRWRVAASEV